MVAPVARAMRLLSVLRRRRIALMPALVRKCIARSDSPFSVMTCRHKPRYNCQPEITRRGLRDDIVRHTGPENLSPGNSLSSSSLGRVDALITLGTSCCEVRGTGRNISVDVIV